MIRWCETSELLTKI